MLVPATLNTPDGNVLGANMGPIWGRQDPGGPHVGPMNLAIWDKMIALVTNTYRVPIYKWILISKISISFVALMASKKYFKNDILPFILKYHQHDFKSGHTDQPSQRFPYPSFSSQQ